MSWYQVKLFASYATSLSMDALHILVGAILLVSIAFLMRTTIGNWRPWLVLLALELLNEANDLWVERWPDPAVQYGESARDILLTMLVPTLLLVLTRKCPTLFVPEASVDDEMPSGPDVGLASGAASRQQDQRETDRE